VARAQQRCLPRAEEHNETEDQERAEVSGVTLCKQEKRKNTKELGKESDRYTPLERANTTSSNKTCDSHDGAEN
jgi:hypothetical protein